MLDSLREGMQNAIQKLLRRSVVDEAAIKEFVRDLQRALIQADVNVKLALDLSDRVQKRALEEKPPGGMTRQNQIVTVLYEELAGLLGGGEPPKLDKNKLNLIVMLGIQGSGKTTTTGKLARYFSKRGFKVGVVAADTFRPGAVTQLRTIAERAGVEVYGDEREKDTVKIAKQGKKFFEATKNLVIVDTAGRHKEEKGLLEEMKTVVAEVKPELTLLVIDGTVGQQSYNQALAFHQASPIGGIVITKLDGAAKGGGALAAAAATGARIMYIGTGERLDDVEEFNPTRFVGRLLGMGDIKALVEMAQQADIEIDQKSVQRMMSGKLTMNDLLAQFEQMKKFGSLKRIVEHLPGVSGSVKDEDLNKAEDRVKVYKVIIQSMTRDEREDPDRLNGARVKRIAFGSGTTEKDVRELLNRYKQTKNLMKSGKSREFRQLMRRMGGQ